MQEIIVETPARLHLGLLDMNGGLGRLYGSMGVAINRPNVVLVARREDDGAANELAVNGLEAERVSSYARRFLASHRIPGKIALRLDSCIPSHVGLGSGTQLALAVGAALAHLGGQPFDAWQMSQLLGRGAHSGIGIAAFQAGGFVVDGGHRVEAQAGPPPVLFRHPLPEAWRFLVAIPAAPPGISGESEQRAFRELPPAPAALAERICRLLVMRLLPGLIEQDIAAFGTALSAIQELVGESFATIQGGRFANSISGDLIGHLLEHGAAGAGQSSWGPALYAVAADSVEADRLAALAREFLAHRSGGDVFVVSGANAGASCRPT